MLMKTLLYTLVASFLASPSIAQIIITSSPTINPGKIDSCNLPTPAALAALPSLAPVLNGSWNIGSTALQPAPFTYTYKTKTSGFSAASFSDSMSYELGAASGLQYTCWRNVQQTGTGVSILGEEILKRQAKGLGTFTGDPLDSLVFSPQVIAYNNSLPILKLPATLSSKWAATTPRVVNFMVTIGAVGLSNAPGQHKQIRSHLDSVVGWGKMKVPIAGKGASAWIPVLQVQHRDIAVDSFFLGGSPAPDNLLIGIGLTQGQSDTVSRTYFYRAGAYRPLVEAVHMAPSHSSTVSKLYMHALDLPEEPNAVPSVSAADDIRVYPNPVRNGKLNIDLRGYAGERWSYTLININGQQIAGGKLSSGNTSISLPADLQAGVYWISLIQADELMSVLPVTVE